MVARPHVLDAAIDPGRASAIAESLDEAAQAARVDAFLDARRRLRGDARPRPRFRRRGDVPDRRPAAVGRARPRQAGRAYSALAQGLVAALLERVGEAFAPSMAASPGGRVAVLAMGKLGSREMTAASDLDLIVIYDFPAERRRIRRAAAARAGALLRAPDAAPPRRADRADQGGPAL